MDVIHGAILQSPWLTIREQTRKVTNYQTDPEELHKKYCHDDKVSISLVPLKFFYLFYTSQFLQIYVFM